MHFSFPVFLFPFRPNPIFIPSVVSLCLCCCPLNSSFKASQFTARVGEWDLSDVDGYSEEFRVLSYVAHPSFRPNGFYNDVAVFKLDQPVQMSA